jgi:hypothetical protein
MIRSSVDIHLEPKYSTPACADLLESVGWQYDEMMQALMGPTLNLFQLLSRSFPARVLVERTRTLVVDVVHCSKAKAGMRATCAFALHFLWAGELAKAAAKSAMVK